MHSSNTERSLFVTLNRLCGGLFGQGEELDTYIAIALMSLKERKQRIASALKKDFKVSVYVSVRKNILLHFLIEYFWFKRFVTTIRLHSRGIRSFLQSYRWKEIAVAQINWEFVDIIF